MKLVVSIAASVSSSTCATPGPNVSNTDRQPHTGRKTRQRTGVPRLLDALELLTKRGHLRGPRRYRLRCLRSPPKFSQHPLTRDELASQSPAPAAEGAGVDHPQAHILGGLDHLRQWVQRRIQARRQLLGVDLRQLPVLQTGPGVGFGLQRQLDALRPGITPMRMQVGVLVDRDDRMDTVAAPVGDQLIDLGLKLLISA
jgi:hypothetical protein